MKFRTEIEPLNMAGAVNHGTPLMFIGSCFSENIGQRLADRLFDVEINPLGTLYNPISVAMAIERIADHVHFTADDLIEGPTDGLFHSFHLHSRFSRRSADEILQVANGSLEQGHNFLRRASWLCVTLGSSWRFIHRKSGLTVANCHKFPGNEFERHFIQPSESADALRKAFGKVRVLNPDIRIMLTVSPIRHLPDGLHGNSLSKAALLLACEEIRDAVYFPSYEILIDDLRDYRYYAADMKHPSDVAVDYIFEIFSRSFFDKSTASLADEALSVVRRLRHRPLTLQDTDKSEEVSTILRNFINRYPELEAASKKLQL